MANIRDEEYDGYSAQKGHIAVDTIERSTTYDALGSASEWQSLAKVFKEAIGDSVALEQEVQRLKERLEKEPYDSKLAQLEESTWFKLAEAYESERTLGRQVATQLGGKALSDV